MKTYKKDLIKYRIARAKETMLDAKIMGRNNRWNSCVNRLYYACFYAVNALMIKYNYSAKTHSGIRSLFSQHFIKPGKVSKDLGKLYNDLFDNRQYGDYSDFVEMSEPIVKPWLDKVPEFISSIEPLLETTKTRNS